ncbi:hypothetical protein AA0113_g8262 [Alternaria arborescens]|uniref:AAA+ ATPase domain-containing protein n=1 Tax=Alternaria arborescens TaxID=156630 RepID=A0A4Q4RJE1_9PLEO|nr:hypothetical protein AA0111_g6559 [Alternaria arborescens]RYO28703.1 hypothetical protein AA0111_g6559 [Alternaria arborescens]RYO56961.1 hypothetical protein AA0113_g8262 [Alternaria arborescens]
MSDRHSSPAPSEGPSERPVVNLPKSVDAEGDYDMDTPSGAPTGEAPPVKPQTVDSDGDHDMDAPSKAEVSDAYDSDSDAMEGVETKPVTETIVIKTKDLPAYHKDLVMKLNEQFYAPQTAVGKPDGNAPPVDSEKFFNLRGQDISSSTLPEGMASGNKLKALVMGGDLFAGIHMETSPELAKFRDAAAEQTGASAAAPNTKNAPTTGLSLNLPIRSATNKLSATSTSALTKPSIPEPPAHECVKVFFHLDSQTPNIEFVTQDPKTDNTMSCRLWAQDMDYDESRVKFQVEKYLPDPTIDRSKPSDKREHHGLRHLEKMSQSYQKTCVIAVTIDVQQASHRHWEGISAADLAAIRSENAQDPKEGEVRRYIPPNNWAAAKDKSRFETRNNLVKMLDQETTFKLYFTCKTSDGPTKQWKKFGGYMRNLLTMAQAYGNFWWYKHQLSEHDVSLSIENPVLAPIDWIVPRWLVTEWSFEKTTSSTLAQSVSKPKPHKWSPLEFPTSGYPNSNEAAFLLKLGVRDEQERQIRDLKELVQSDGTKWFKGRFRRANTTGVVYVVEVYLGLEQEMADANIKIPQPGTRIRFAVDKDATKKPSKKNSVSFEGIVVYDSLGTKASFICVVDCRHKALAVADSSVEYNLFISYLVDKTTSKRMLEGIALLQTNKESYGPDSRGVVLGCRNTAFKTDILKTEFDETRLGMFETSIDEMHPPSNASQKEAMMNTCRSDTGNVVIIGPPGTGKSATIDKIGHAHLALDRRVMYCAPMNSNVHGLIDKFVEYNQATDQQKYSDNEWVLVTGGYTTIDKARKLRKSQDADIQDLENANARLSSYVKDAKNRKNVPHYERTLGYKVRQQIDVFAANDKYDESDGKGLYTDAKRYLKLEHDLPYLQDDSARKEAKDELDDLEHQFTVHFLKKVKVLFCTVSTSAHPLVQDSGDWDILVIDEAARETRAGIAVALGTLHGRVKLIVWAGDYEQGTGVITGQDSNVGYNLLARNVFESLAGIKKAKDEASPCEVIILNTCYRMQQSLIDWSSHHLYDDKVKSHEDAGKRDMPLRNTLRRYWANRLPDDFTGNFTEIGIDVTHEGFASELLTGTTTRLNRHEARQIACTVVDMLSFEPPKSKGEPCRRILAEDICLISNFTGQVMELRKAVKHRAEEMEFDLAKLEHLLYHTTAEVQGKERNITMYCTVLADGTTRLAQQDRLPIGFVADIKNLNVSVTRCKIARYTFGALKLFLQAQIDNHTISKNKRYSGFFDFMSRLNSMESIIAYKDSERWFRDGSKPNDFGNFRKSLEDAVSYTSRAANNMPNKAPARQNRMTTGQNRMTTTVQNNFQAPPRNVRFAGDREGGLLRASRPAGVQKENSKRRGGQGGAKKGRRDDREDGGGSGHGTESGQGQQTQW